MPTHAHNGLLCSRAWDLKSRPTTENLFINHPLRSLFSTFIINDELEAVRISSLVSLSVFCLQIEMQITMIFQNQTMLKSLPVSEWEEGVVPTVSVTVNRTRGSYTDRSLHEREFPLNEHEFLFNETPHKSTTVENESHMLVRAWFHTNSYHAVARKLQNGSNMGLHFSHW